MTEIFLSIINMSISASYIVLAVLLMRLLLKKAPKWLTIALWGIVAVRLICPFSIESMLSLIPSAETVSPGIMTDNTPTINTGIPILNNTFNPIIGESFAPNPGDSVNPLQVLIPIFTAIWIAGVAALLVYTVISYGRVKRKIGTAVLLRDNIYQSENVVSPFVLGVIKPKIYLPFNMDEKDMVYVVAHENAHIRRKDHLWKPVGFLLLALHWFNPLMWLGYVLLCRDIELACDEKVIKELDHDARADYSEALLTCSINRRIIAACPLAFGEVGVKERVKSVLNYKKPAFWIIIAAVVICVAVAVCFLTNPPQKPDDPEIFTEYEGVYLSVNTIDVNADGHGTFDLVMYNNTKNQVTYGSAYIQCKEGDKWISLALDTLDSAYSGYLLNPDSAEHLLYTTMKLDVSSGGTYRLVIPFSVDDGNGDESYNAWIEFNADDLPIIENNGRYTEYEGVYLRTDTININTDGHYVFKLVMYNNTDKQVTYGLNYFIQRKDGDEWVSVATEDLIFVSVAYRLNPGRGEVLTYTSEKFDLSEPGTYRLVVPFSIDDGDGYKDYKTWIEFKSNELPESESIEPTEIYACLAYDAYSSLHCLNIRVENGRFYVRDSIVGDEYILYDRILPPDNLEINFEPRPLVNIPDEHLEKLKNSEVLYFLTTESKGTVIKQLAIYDIGDTYYIYHASDAGFSFAPYVASHTTESYLPTPLTVSLREKYPQFFGLDTSKGLDVYVHQMAENHYGFTLYAHSDAHAELGVLQYSPNVESVTALEMNAILSTYQVGREYIHIIPWQHPFSSYIADYWIVIDGEDEEEKRARYIEKVRSLLFGLSDAVSSFSPWILDSAAFDIDNDGTAEICTLQDAMLSGPSGFTFSVRETGSYKAEYSTLFYGYFRHSLSFQRGADGVMRVKVITPGEKPETYFLDITFEDGNLQLLRDGVPLQAVGQLP